MKRSFFILITGILTVLFVCFYSTGSAISAPAESQEVVGAWTALDGMSPRAPLGGDAPLIDLVESRTYFVSSGRLPETTKQISFGATLDLKYFSGISYSFLKKHLPGKTISLKIKIPEEAVSSFSAIPNKLRIALKSEKNGKWADHYGSKEWFSVQTSDVYSFSIKIPEAGSQEKTTPGFSPEDIVLISVDLFLMEGSKRQSFAFFEIFDLEIEGIKLDPNQIRWQKTKNGYIVPDSTVPFFERNSTSIISMETNLMLSFSPGTSWPQNMKDSFLSLEVFLPSELRRQKGTLSFTIKDTNNIVRSAVKDFQSCDLEGNVFLAMPLEAFASSKKEALLSSDLSITLRIKTSTPHTVEMLPVVLSPLRLFEAQLVSFNDSWEVRDIQGLGGYTSLDIQKDGSLQNNGISVTALKPGLYQLNATVRLQGGIDWTNPFYKVELVKYFDNAPVNLDNYHLEVIISPLSQTLAAWQKPYRARIGLIDENNKVMLGPNISLSEGLPSVAYLDVSTASPTPKGLVMNGFDPKRISGILLNLEASHAKAEPVNIKLSFSNLSIMSPKETKVSPVKRIDFSAFKRTPASWEISKIVKKSGGYAVGINYPFPILDLPADILAVPQIYPCVGQKPSDATHFGFANNLTKQTVLKHFKIFVDSEINIVRLITLGHLEGVFNWDEKGKDILGFGDKKIPLIKKLSLMPIEEFVEFLNANENTLFSIDKNGTPSGLEEHVLPDFIAFLDILEQIEKDTGKRLVAILALYDFLLGDNVLNEGPMREFRSGEHKEVVTDPEIKVKAHAILWKLMKTLSKDKRFYRYIACMEIMNEPANATALTTKAHFSELVNFVGEGLYVLKDVLGPDMPVSVGFKSWPADLRYWHPISDGIDILMIHYWESLESYNINVPGLWPLDMPVSKLWQYLGTPADGRLTSMGEIGPGGDFSNNLSLLQKAGYDFSLVWSYSGHDSYDAKPAMDIIKNYQEATLRSAQVARHSETSIKKAFSFLFSLISSFENPISKKVFYSFSEKKLGELRQKKIRNIVSSVLSIAELKDIVPSKKKFETLQNNIMRLKKR